MAEATCPSCSAALAEDARFCHWCGKAIPASDPTEFASTEAARLACSAGRSAALPPMRLAAGHDALGLPDRGGDRRGRHGRRLPRPRHRARPRRRRSNACTRTSPAIPRSAAASPARPACCAAGATRGAVAIHDFIEHEHLLAIVMELVDGETLAEHLARWRGRMPFDRDPRDLRRRARGDGRRARARRRPPRSQAGQHPRPTDDAVAFARRSSTSASPRSSRARPTR